MKTLKTTLTLFAALAAFVFGAPRASAGGLIQYSSYTFTVSTAGTVTITGTGAMDMSDMGDVINNTAVPYQILNSSSTVVWSGEVTVNSSGMPVSSSGMSYAAVSGGQGVGAWSWNFTVSTSLAAGQYQFQYVKRTFAYGGAGSDAGAVFVVTNISGITGGSPGSFVGVTFTASPLSFVYNGVARGPSVSPNPANATYAVSGTPTAVDVGSYSLTVTGTGIYQGSLIQAWNITPAGQTVTLNPSATTVTAGTTVTFTAAGSNTGYTWSGGPSGGATTSYSWGTPGSYVVSVYGPASGDYNQSNTASVTITVTAIATTFGASPLSFTYNGGSQGPTIAANPGGATYSTGGTASAVNAGSYTVTEAANGLYGGFGSQGWTINPASQSVSLSPTSPTVTAGGSVTFTASGGNNGYNWGGSASGNGATQSVTFPNVGTYTVTVSSPAGGNYSASNTASATITVGPIAQTISLSNPTQTISVNQNATSTASGSNTGYSGSWGTSGPGPAGFSGGVFSFTPSATGTFTYNIFAPASGNYAQSNTVTATVTATAAAQTVTISPPIANITAGQAVTFTASGGNTSYTWGGSASGSGASQTVTFPTAGNYTVTVFAPAGGTWAQSNTATANVTVTAPQPQNVSISPPGASITAGQSVSFTVSGGNTSYTWGGSASGSGASQSVTFPTAGNYTVTVFARAGGTWAQSNTATATITVMPQQPQNVMITPPMANITAGQAVTFTASGGNTSYTWGGSASGSGVSQSVTFPTAGNYTVTVFAPAGGTWAQSPTATANVIVMPQQPQNVVISPPAANITASQSVTFTASGGNTSYTWGGSASGSGTSQSVTFPTAGNYNVTVYAPAGGTWAQSNTATSTVTVMPQQPQNVVISPPMANITAGQSVTFNANGGQNGYVWGGSASGSGPSQSITFPNVGNYSVTASSPAGGLYQASNVATANIIVSPAPQTVTISPVAPSIAAGNSVSFTASGGLTPYVWGGSAAGSGSSQSASFFNIGLYTVSVYSLPGGNFAQSNTAVSTVTVTAIPQTIAISPITTTTFAGVPVPFTASGSHTGYTWGGSAAGSGSAQSVTFASQGTYTVTVAAPASGNYAASNTAIATITVKAAPPKITSTNDKNTVEVQDQETKGPNAIQAPAH